MQYYKVEPREKVGIVTVDWSSQGAEATHVQGPFENVALSEKGRSFVAHFSKGTYESFKAEWEELIGDYFTSAGE